MLQYEVQPTIPSNYYTTIQHYKDDNHWELAHVDYIFLAHVDYIYLRYENCVI